MLAALQGVQTQVLTSKLESAGQQAQPTGQLQHVFGVRKLGLGMSSQLQSGDLLCTGQLTCATPIMLSFHSVNTLNHSCSRLDHIESGGSG